MKKLLITVLAALLLITTVGCGKSSPSKVVEKSIKDYKTELKKSISEEINNADADAQTKVIFKLVSDFVTSFDYKIDDEKIDGKKATVTVTINHYDIGKAIANGLKDYLPRALQLAFSGKELTEKAMTDLLTEIFTEQFTQMKKEGKTYTKTMDVTLTKNGKDWELDKEIQDVFADALTGGLYSAFKGFAGSFNY